LVFPIAVGIVSLPTILSLWTPLTASKTVLMNTMLKVKANTTNSDDMDDIGDPKNGIKPALTAQAMLMNISFEPGICAKLLYLKKLENFFGTIETLYAIPNKDAKKKQTKASTLTVNAKIEEINAAAIACSLKIP